MRVRQEQVGVERPPRPRLHAEHAEAGAAIENEKLFTVLQDRARGIATVARRARTGDGDGAADSVKPEDGRTDRRTDGRRAHRVARSKAGGARKPSVGPSVRPSVMI